MSDGSDRNRPDAIPEGTSRGAERDRAEARDVSEAARRAAERAAGRALDEPDTGAAAEHESAADATVDPAALPEGARRLWAEHLFVHGLLSALSEIESNADARDARVETVMTAVRRSPKRTSRPWLHYAAAAAVLVFLVIGGLQLFQPDPAPDLSSLESVIEGLAEDLDLEYIGDVAFERSDRPLESLECQFITGPDRFYVKTKFPSPMGPVPIEFGGYHGRRWVNFMGFPIDASGLEQGLSRMGGMAGLGRNSPMGFVDPMRLLTDLGALLRKMRETCDVELSDGGVGDDGERLTRVLGTPRDAEAALGIQSIEVCVGGDSDIVKSFTIVCIPPKRSIDEAKPRSNANDRRSKFRERLRKRRMNRHSSIERVTLNYRLVRTLRAERELFLPAALGDPPADEPQDGPGEAPREDGPKRR